jgi:hypothetical protein
MVNPCLTRRINVMALKMMDHANREPGVEEGVENANGEMKVRGTVNRHQISRPRQTKQRGVFLRLLGMLHVRRIIGDIVMPK